MQGLRSRSAIVVAVVLAIAGSYPAQAGAVEVKGQAVSVDQLDSAATARYWTADRMAAATPSGHAAVAGGPPPGTPTATEFTGVPTVGALFFADGSGNHYCSASVVNSLTRNLVLTAAHCVYSATSGSATTVEYVPGYHDGQRPYGVYPGKSVAVSDGWKQRADINVDFAVLTVAPDPSTGRQVQAVTGGNWLGVDLGYDHQIEAIGYPMTTEEPVHCATRSFAAPVPSQLQFNCDPFPDGTSGGPFLIGYNPRRGSGIVIGVIGGYEQGGDFTWTSYSSYFDEKVLALYISAELAQGRSVGAGSVVAP
jgi:V8-like Glu-specific endopeptidase